MALETGDADAGKQQQGSVVDDILHLKDDQGGGQGTETRGTGDEAATGQGERTTVQAEDTTGQGQGERTTVQPQDTTGQTGDAVTGDPALVSREATQRLSTEAHDTGVEQANSGGPKPVPKELEGEIVFDQPAPSRDATDTTGGRVETLDEIIRNAGAIQKEVNDVVQHMDSAGARLREINAGNPSEQEKDQRLLRAMESFTEATKVVTPEEQESYKRQREIIKRAMESETDVEKLKELKIIERNLNVLEHAPGFTRGNAALALYQAGKIRPVEMDGQTVSPARKWLEDAIKADPSLIRDENFHRRRREIERKFDVDIAKDMIDFIDSSARRQGPGQEQGQEQGQDQGRDQGRTRPVGDGTESGVEQPQTGNLSPSRNGKSPYENAAAAFQAVTVVDDAGNRQIKWPDDPAEAQRIKAQFEQAMADADAGDTPNRAALEERIADAENKKVQTPIETSKGTETVAQTAVRVTQSMTQVFGNLPADKQDPAKDLFVKMNEAKTMEDYRKSATDLKALVGENPEFDALMGDHAKAAETYINFSNQSELLSRKLAFEVNDSATVRSLYATALKGSGSAEDQARVKELSADAYGRNIDGDLIDSLRTDALSNGVKPAELLDAALKRPEQDKDGGSYGGMSLDVMAAEASLLFDIARGANKPAGEMPDQATLTANTAAAMEQFGPLFDRLSTVVGGKVTEGEANRGKIIEQRDQLLPQEPEKKARALELQGQISGFEGFEDGEIDQARVLVTPNASAEDVAAARKSLTDSGKGDWLGKFDEWRGLVGDNASKLLMLQGLEYNNDSQTLTFRDLQFRTRGMHAQALLDGGKQGEAKDKLKEALDGLPEDMRGQYAGSAKVSELAGKVGLDLAPYNPVANQGDQGDQRTGDQGQGQGQGTVDRTTDGGEVSEPPRDMRLANMTDTELMQSVIDAATVKVKSTNAEGQVTEGILENNDLIKKNIQPIRVGLEELIRRNDSIAVDGQIVPFDFEEEARNVAKMQEILRTGKDPDTGETINLTDADRFQMHRGIINTFRIAQNQVDYRLQLAEKLRVAGQYEDATRYFTEAVEKADLIKKNFMPDGKDMIKAEVELATTDTAAMDNAPRFPLEAGGEPKVGYADVLNEGIARISGAAPGSSDLRLAPVEARMLAANNALGAKSEASGQFRAGVTFNENGTDKPMPIWTDTYGERPGWSGAEGGRLIKEAVEQFESIEGYNPLKPENQARSQLTGQLGVLVDRARGMSDESLQSMLKETSGFDQALSFGAAMTAAGLMLVATAGTRGKEGRPIAASLTRSVLRVGAAVTVAGGTHALTYRGLTGEWERPQDALFHGVASTLTAGVMYKMIRGEKGNLNLINQEWSASAMRGLSARAPRIAGLVQRTGSTFGDATGKLSSQDVAKVAEAGGFQTAESLAAGFRRLGLDDLALKFDPATSGLKAGTRATAPEVVRIIEANGLKNNIFEMMSLVGRNTKFDAGAVARSLETQGVRTLDDFVAMTERPLTSLRAGSQEIIRAGLPDETLLSDAAKSGTSGLDDAFLQAARENKITRVGDLKKFLAEGGGYEKLTMAERWPLIQAMRNAGLEGSTSMSEVAARGVQIFDVGLGSGGIGKEFRLRNTQSAAFAEATEGVAQNAGRRSVSQWGSDMWSATRRQVQVSPLEVTEATTARDLARMPRQVEILQRNRNYLKGLVGLGLYRNTSRVYELTQGGMSLGDAMMTANFPTQHVRENASSFEVATAKVMGPFMSTPLAPLLTMKMFSPTGRAVPLWSSPMGKTMGTWGRTMEYIGPGQRLWQNLTSTSASSSMDGLLARSLTGTRNAVAPMVGLSTPLAISTFFDDYGERQFAQGIRTKLDYAGQELENAPFVEGHRELKTLREYLDEQTKKASDEAAARKAAEDEAARKAAEDEAARRRTEEEAARNAGETQTGDVQTRPAGNDGQPGGNVQANPDDF